MTPKQEREVWNDEEAHRRLIAAAPQLFELALEYQSSLTTGPADWERAHQIEALRRWIDGTGYGGWKSWSAPDPMPKVIDSSAFAHEAAPPADTEGVKL